MSANATLICPAPLVTVPFGTSTEGSVEYVAPNQCDCALPCPQLIYTADEWTQQKDVLFVGSLLSVITALIVLITHLGESKRYFLRLMFISGFLLNALVVFIFASMNHRKNAVVCGDAGTEFLQQTGLCVFQGAATIWAFTWIEYWSVVLSYDSYMMVSQRARGPDRGEKKRNYYYVLGAFVVCSILTFIPLAANNYGFDPLQNVPLCLFIFSEDSTYFWACFIVPLALMVSLCACFSILGMIEMHRIFVNSNHNYSGRKNKYGGQQRGGGGGDGDGDDGGRDSQSHITDNTYSSGVNVSEDSDDSDDNNFAGVRDSMNPLSETASIDFSPDRRQQQQQQKQQKQQQQQQGISRHSQASMIGDSRAGAIDGDGSSELSFESGSQARAPLLAAGYMSGSDVSRSGPSRHSLNSELNNLLGGALMLDADDDLIGGVDGGGVEGVHGEEEEEDEVPVPLLQYSSGGARAASNSALNQSTVSDSTVNTALRGRESDATSTPSKSGGPPRGSDSVRVSAVSTTSIYRSVASFWTRSSTKDGVAKNRGGGEHDRYTSYSEYDTGSVYGEDEQYAGLTSQRLARQQEGNEDGGGSDDGRSDRISKETISLGTGVGPNRSRDYSTARKQSAANTRTSMLRNIVKGEAIRQTLRYNGRGLLFVFVYCLSTLYIVPVLYVMQAITYDRWQRSGENFITCLITASYQSAMQGVVQTQSEVDSYAHSLCGEIPSDRPANWLVYSGLVWLSGYGIIPALIFGVGSRFADSLTSLACCANLLRSQSKSSKASFSSGDRAQSYSDSNR